MFLADEGWVDLSIASRQGFVAPSFAVWGAGGHDFVVVRTFLYGFHQDT